MPLSNSISNAIPAQSISAYEFIARIAAFVTRVNADGGTTEATGTCMQDTLLGITPGIYSNAAYLHTANSFNQTPPDTFGVTYSLIPDDGSGDLRWIRWIKPVRIDSDGYYEQAANYYTPPLSYPELGGCPHYLGDPARTNSLTYYDTLNDASYTYTNSSHGTAAQTNPWGSATSQKLIEDSTNSSHFFIKNSGTALTAATVYTASVLVKANGRNVRVEFIDSTGTDGARADYNLSTEALIGLSAQGAGSNQASTITEHVNGWYRITVTAAMNNTRTSGGLRVWALDGTSDTYLGDGASGLYTSTCQLEAGSYASMPIPTVASATARDYFAVSGLSTPMTLPQAEGVFYFEFYPTMVTGIRSLVNMKSSAGNFLNVYLNASHIMNCDCYIISPATYSHGVSGGTALMNQWNKVAIKYKAGDYEIYLNGTMTGSSSNATAITAVPSDFAISFNASTFNFKNILVTSDITIDLTTLTTL
jgi:hypothetical protein